MTVRHDRVAASDCRVAAPSDCSSLTARAASWSIVGSVARVGVLRLRGSRAARFRSAQHDNFQGLSQVRFSANAAGRHSTGTERVRAYAGGNGALPRAIILTSLELFTSRLSCDFLRGRLLSP
jgi:hypothetical protein